ncbi:MAG: 2-hydroxyglutaryl-CoA dehydratase [Burkholderiaceae bacterium]|nr:2-hydroxyglutaryl-CoA dehydratase [Burkholderiaceae bacterium]
MTIYAAGVDSGSTQTKGIILDENRRIVGRGLVDTGANTVKSAERAFLAALADAGLCRDDVVYTVGTGYGRYKITFGDTQITEITCHAKGAHFIFPKTRTVVDIGGQDTKGIRINETGEVLDFVMNDKCAAGTGRFLGVAAQVLELPLDDLGPLSLQATKPVDINSTCTVFAETEILSYLAQKKKLEDILMGMHHAIAARTASLLMRVGMNEELTFTGGVSRNKGMVLALEQGLGVSLNVSEESHFTGAIGAAVFALDRALVPDVGAA